MPRSPAEREALAAKWRDHNLQKKTPKLADAPVRKVEVTEDDSRWDKHIDSLLDAAPVLHNYQTVQVPGGFYRRYVGSVK